MSELEPYPEPKTASELVANIKWMPQDMLPKSLIIAVLEIVKEDRLMLFDFVNEVIEKSNNDELVEKAKGLKESIEGWIE